MNDLDTSMRLRDIEKLLRENLARMQKQLDDLDNRLNEVGKKLDRIESIVEEIYRAV